MKRKAKTKQKTKQKKMNKVLDLQATPQSSKNKKEKGPNYDWTKQELEAIRNYANKDCRLRIFWRDFQ
jgi:hypothetical protein